MARQKKDTGKPTSRHCFSLPASDQTKRRQGSRQTGKNTSRLCLSLSHTKKDKTAKQTYGQTDKPTLFQPARVGPDRGSEADRRTNRQTDKQTSSASACLSVTHTERQRSRQTYGQTDGQTDKQAWFQPACHIQRMTRQRSRHTDRQTIRHCFSLPVSDKINRGSETDNTHRQTGGQPDIQTCIASARQRRQRRQQTLSRTEDSEADRRTDRRNDKQTNSEAPLCNYLSCP